MAKEHQHQLVKQLEHLLATLSKIYERGGAQEKLALIVNGVPRIQEGWSFDNWNGGTHGHALHLDVPAAVYPASPERKLQLEEELKADLNPLFTVQDEFVDVVFIGMVLTEDEDWRQKSGAMLGRRPNPPVARLERLWSESGFRLFLSHKAEFKREAALLKEHLKRYAVSVFVAHEDVHPTKPWQDEIECALASMDGFLALLTKGFDESRWTGQEIGYAVARGVPIIPIRHGMDPFGFIGGIQALTCPLDAAPKKIVKLLLKEPQMMAAYLTAVEKCGSWDAANSLAELFTEIEVLEPSDAARLVNAHNTNPEVSASFGFIGNWPSKYGDGLLALLRRATGGRYDLEDGKVVLSASSR